MKNKKAITTVWIYVIIFIVLVLIFVGYAFWDNYQKTKKLTNTVNPVVPNPNPTPVVTKPIVKINSTIYPNKELTPGFYLTMDADFLCIPGTPEKLNKNTTDDMKREIFDNYHLSYPPHKEYQMDRYIPVNLGGSPDNIKNIWPQSVDYPGFKEKDQVETYLYNQVCNKTINLTTAQEKIKTDWVAVYNECCSK